MASFDLAGFNRLADELEDEAILRVAEAGRRSVNAATVVAVTHHVSRHDKQGRVCALAADVAERHKSLLNRLA